MSTNEPKLICQECRGIGEIIEDRIEWYEISRPCGFCNGSGYLTNEIRGLWLRIKKEEKYDRRSIMGCIQECES
jgi:DnaJ-class molecular chaperone